MTKRTEELVAGDKFEYVGFIGDEYGIHVGEVLHNDVASTTITISQPNSVTFAHDYGLAIDYSFTILTDEEYFKKILEQ